MCDYAYMCAYLQHHMFCLHLCFTVFQEIIEISADYHNMIEGVVVHVLDRATNTRTAATSITFFNNVNIDLSVCMSFCSVCLSVGRSVTVRLPGYLSTCNVRGPKVVIALRSSVFFWPRSFPSKSAELLKGGIIWKEIICPMDWYIKYSRPIKGVRVVGIEMGVPNCVQNFESVESWRRYWYRSGETK